jgi:hypothetical protein
MTQNLHLNEAMWFNGGFERDLQGEIHGNRGNR